MALEREIQGSDQRVEGPVRITALDALLDKFIIPRLPRLWQPHPGLELTLVSDLRLLDLSRREADIAIRAVKPTHPDAVARRLGSLATAAYVARDLKICDAPPIAGFPRELDEGEIARALRDAFPGGRIVVSHAISPSISHDFFWRLERDQPESVTASMNVVCCWGRCPHQTERPESIGPIGFLEWILIVRWRMRVQGMTSLAARSMSVNLGHVLILDDGENFAQ